MADGTPRRPNLSIAAECYLDRLGAGMEDLFHLRAGRAARPRVEANAGAADGVAAHASGLAGRRRDRPTPSPHRPRGAGSWPRCSTHTPVQGVTTGTLRPEAAAVAVPSTTDGGNMAGGDLLTGLGPLGRARPYMPGHPRRRAYHRGR